MTTAISIELLKNLAQYDYNNKYYDFHNDYNHIKMSYSSNILLISFRHFRSGEIVSLKFIDVEIVNIDFFNVKEVDSLTLDNLYRGRVELNGNLIEASNNGKGYFYLEFYEGQKMEFWAEYIDVVD
jgi:hypothetical protein